MKKFSTRMLVEAGVMIALSWVLSQIKLYQMPYGGEITAGKMVPLILFAIRWGVGPGLFAGAVYGIVDIITQQSFFAGLSITSVVLSVLLDYILAFSLLGLAGFARKSLPGILTGVFLGITGRFLCHFISGIVIWSSFAPENMKPWVYSLAYNGAYILPELGICLVIVGLLYRPLKRYITE